MGFDPYHKWLSIPVEEQPPNHYRLLGLSLFEHDPDVIHSAADRQMAHVQTYKTGPHSEFSQQLLNEIAIAKLCLLDPQKRTDYDATLRQPTLVAPQESSEATPPQTIPAGITPPSTNALEVFQNLPPVAWIVAAVAAVGLPMLLLSIWLLFSAGAEDQRT